MSDLSNEELIRQLLLLAESIASYTINHDSETIVLGAMRFQLVRAATPIAVIAESNNLLVLVDTYRRVTDNQQGTMYDILDRHSGRYLMGGQ